MVRNALRIHVHGERSLSVSNEFNRNFMCLCDRDLLRLHFQHSDNSFLILGTFEIRIFWLRFDAILNNSGACVPFTSQLLSRANAVRIFEKHSENVRKSWKFPPECSRISKIVYFEWIRFCSWWFVNVNFYRIVYERIMQVHKVHVQEFPKFGWNI